MNNPTSATTAPIKLERLYATTPQKIWDLWTQRPAAEQIEFMESAGMPLATDSRKTFTDVRPISYLAYVSRIDFVPGVEPYDHLTTVEFSPAGHGTTVVMTIDPLHDEVWTSRIRAGRENELDNLAKVIG